MRNKDTKVYIARYGLLEKNGEISDLDINVDAANIQNAIREASRTLCEKYAHDDSIKSWDIQSVGLAPWEQPWI